MQEMSFEELDGIEHGRDICHWLDQQLTVLEKRPQDQCALFAEFFDTND